MYGGFKCLATYAPIPYVWRVHEVLDLVANTMSGTCTLHVYGIGMCCQGASKV